MKIWDLAARAGRFAWCAHLHPVGVPPGRSPRRAVGPDRALDPLSPPLDDAVSAARGPRRAKRSMGDVLMCTPALRELKRRNPGCHLTFYTDFPALVEGLPFMDSVRPAAERPARGILLNYENSLPPRRHIAQIIGDYLGVNVRDVRPSCTVRPDLVERVRLDWSGRPRPWIVVIRRAGPWTPNKDWPEIYWEALLDRLLASMTVVEIGTGLYGRRTRPRSELPGPGRSHVPAAARGVDRRRRSPHRPGHRPDAYRGRRGDAVGRDLWGVHRSGVHRLSREHRLLQCRGIAPCWLRIPCPIGLKCLHKITPGQVEAAVDRLWADIRRLRQTAAAGMLRGTGPRLTPRPQPRPTRHPPPLEPTARDIDPRANVEKIRSRLAPIPRIDSDRHPPSRRCRSMPTAVPGRPIATGRGRRHNHPSADGMRL